MDPDLPRQERIKLFANYLNITAAGCAIGALVTAPLTLVKSGIFASNLMLILFQVAYVVLLVSLHLIARLVLSRL